MGIGQCGSPEFMRPLGACRRRRRASAFYAAEIARGPSRWWVLLDRTQAPSGAGFRA